MKKSLSQAVAMATLLGTAATAHAVNVNPDGLGSALLYSLYTTEAGKNTSINVTNTTGDYKAVKVRFLEGLNSKEVLDFNLYLSPYDQWGATVVVNPETGGAMLQHVADTSCTAPDMNDGLVVVNPRTGDSSATHEFKDYEYRRVAADGLNPAIAGDAGRQELTRTRVGHVEVIEMGVVDEAYGLTTIKHGENRQPADCNALRTRLLSGDWATDDINADITPATGGLYGTASIIDPQTANVITYDAVAIDNFYGELPLAVHTPTGDVRPSLENANTFASFPDGTEIEFARGVDAVSAVLMKSSIQNDYLVGDELKGETNWVVTFPTKNHYVNSPDNLPVAPFTSIFGADGAPERLTYSFWDNEEQEILEGDAEGPVMLPSPLPPGYVAPVAGSFLPWETNIIKFDGKSVLASEYENLNLDISDLSSENRDFSFAQGWVRFDFSANPDHVLVGDVGSVVGLPVIGFSAITVQNGDTGESGAIANFSGQYQHKATTTLIID